MSSTFRQTFFIRQPPLTEVNCPDQSNRVFIVTGGYNGIGLELTRILYSHNGTVYIAGRSAEKAEAAISDIKASAPDSKGRVEFMSLDLSDLTTIKPAVDRFLQKEERLDVLVNNAGVMWPPEGSLSAQSHDLQFATNCLSHYLLYSLLLPILATTAALPSTPKVSVRVAWAASIGVDIASPHPYGMDIDMETGEPKDLGTTMNYGQSKVGKVYFSKVLAEQTKDNGVVHTAFNPGNLWTGLQRHWFGLAPWVLRTFLLYNPIWGAYTEFNAILSPDITTENSGAYVIPWGHIGAFRKGVEDALKRPEGAPQTGGAEGRRSVAEKFVCWCERETAPFR